jgi:SAM-dependent methyltransferase
VREPTSASGQAHPPFGADRLALIERLERSHFWFAGRRALVERLLDRHLSHRGEAALDIGCGTGAFLPVLARYAEHVVGVDPLAEEDGDLVRASAEHLPFDSDSFDVVVALDVLEHADDATALKEVRRVLRPGGVVILTVPALPWLWSARDELAGHRRRYRRRELTRLVETAGLEVTETAYYQFVLLPLVALSRAVGRLRPETTIREEQPPELLNRFLGLVNRLEVRVGARLQLPAGSTLALAARRPTP